MNIGLILSGGVGSRFGANLPKQYFMLLGNEVISYNIDAFRAAKKIDRVVVVADPMYFDKLKERYGVELCACGDTRNRSIKNGLDYIFAHYPECKKVIINDSARPMVSASLVDAYMDKLDNVDAVITGQRIVDSIGHYGEHVLDRSQYYLIQAPEAFNFPIMYAAFDPESKITATNQQMPEGSSLYINFDFVNNLKVTYQSDIEVLAKYLEQAKES